MATCVYHFSRSDRCNFEKIHVIMRQKVRCRFRRRQSPIGQDRAGGRLEQGVQADFDVGRCYFQQMRKIK